MADEREMNVLATTGVQSETRLAFAGLQQLLRPVRAQATGLTATHQAVLDAAFGIGGDEPRRSTFVSRWPFSTCLAMRRPTVLCCWPSRTPTGWTSLRWTSSASSREGLNQIRSSCWPRFARAIRAFSARTSCPSFGSSALDPASATRLLADSGDQLSAGERTRILREAAGNPLALVELPSIAHRLDDDQLMPGWFR